MWGSTTFDLPTIFQGGESRVVALEVSAVDSSSSIRSIKVDVKVVQAADGGVAPEFLDMTDGQYVFNVPENITKGSLLEPSIEVQLSGTGEKICIWSFGSSNDDSDRLFGYTNPSPTQIRMSRMQIKVAQQLDYDDASVRRHTFEVKCRDSTLSYLESNAEVVINVLDVNDEIPFFSDTSNVFSLYEDASIGDVVGSVTAADDDGGTVLTYSLSSSINPDWFRIATETGQIEVNGVLTRSQWVGTARVSDGAPSANNDVGEPNENERTVLINIYDVNDQKPVVVPQAGSETQPFEILESIGVNFPIAGFDAEDEDEDPAQSFTFSITADSGFVPFTISSQGGLLKVSDQLDADGDNAQTEYNFNIQVNFFCLKISPKITLQKPAINSLLRR